MSLIFGLGVMFYINTNVMNTDKKINDKSYWHPKSIHEIKTRRLPNANVLYSDFFHWKLKTKEDIVLLYSAYISCPKSRDRYDFYYGIGNKGYVFNTSWSTISFDYINTTNGRYRLECQYQGNKLFDFIELSRHKREFLLQPAIPKKEDGIPRLLIVGIQGVRRFRGVSLLTTEWFNQLDTYNKALLSSTSTYINIEAYTFTNSVLH